MKELVTQSVIVAAFKTFLQAFTAALLITDNPFGRDILVAALAAGISAVWNSRQSILSKVGR